MGSSEGADALLAEASLVAGRYRVEGQLGQGGMGSIYRVRDERTGKTLALKRLRASKSGSASLLSVQFEREYHTLSQLAHPRIIEVFDYGVEDGEPYYTMELLDGQDLFQRGKMTWRQACPVLCDVASSLAILHSRRLLHRDVSARNVRLTTDGRAKLIDFGAMAPMGPVKHVVGTPPFLSPEALQRQSLDGRSDLYALGSLAYWLLTGHYAYPARSLEQLRELFGSTPQSPKQSGVELPDELDRLVMDLLQLDRSQRPSSAAEVMERLSGIAGLSLDELPEVSKAYLSTPMLVGRDTALQDARLLLRNSVQARGSTLLVSGNEGTGRSRFLDACVLEAKLLGATVLRADASDGAGSEFGIARELGEQLLETLPDLALKTARLWRTQLSVLLPRLAPQGFKPPAERDRHKLQGALRNWFLLIARTRQLVIAVDDYDDIDAASATFLAALGLAARRRRLSLILTHRTRERDGARLQALRETARSVTLENLDLGETEALLHSVFGDIDHVAGIAARIYELSRGNPRWTMMLAETLVERKLARYEAGSWALPAHLASSDLPDSITSALEARALELPADALALAEALSLSEPTRLPVDGYVHLVPEGTHAAGRRALHYLLERQVLRPDESGYRFTQQEMCDVLRKRVTHDREAALHERLSRAALMGDDSVLIARHWLQCGRGAEAIERLIPLRDDPSLSFSARMLDVIQLALRVAEELRLSVRIRNELKEWLIAQAGALGQLELFKRYAFELLERMERDSGLADYLAADSSIPEAERLQRALEAARARYEALPSEQRGLAPEQAALRLGRICSIITMMSGVANEFALVERLPQLAPFFPLHPQLRVSQAHVNTMFYLQSGRAGRGVAAVREVLKLIEDPECKLDRLYKNELRKSHLWMLALFSATSGAQAHEEAGLRELEHVRGIRVLAFRTRMAIEMALGNNEAAARCRKRAEVLLVEDAGLVPFAGTTALVELAVYAAADDVVGTKRAMERLVPMAEAFPSWAPHMAIARAEYLRLQGDYAKALAMVEEALPKAPAQRHIQWGKLADLHVTLLSKLGRHDDALRASAEYRATAERLEQNSAAIDLLHSAAEALTAAGRPEEALPLIEECMRRREASGTRGVFLGRVLETRARVAIALRDQQGMHEYADRCAREYKRLGNAGLSRKYESLLREAEAAGLLLTTGVRQAAELRDSLVSESLSYTGSSRIFASLGSVERVEEGLRAFVEQSGGESGVVFAMIGGAEMLELRASLGDVEVEPPMFEAAVLYVQQQMAEEEENTTFDAIAPSTQAQRGFTDSTGRVFEPTLLYAPREAQRLFVGLALVHYRPAGRKAVRRELLDSLGEALMPATGVGRHSAPIGPPDRSG